MPESSLLVQATEGDRRLPGAEAGGRGCERWTEAHWSVLLEAVSELGHLCRLSQVERRGRGKHRQRQGIGRRCAFCSMDWMVVVPSAFSFLTLAAEPTDFVDRSEPSTATKPSPSASRIIDDGSGTSTIGPWTPGPPSRNARTYQLAWSNCSTSSLDSTSAPWKKQPPGNVPPGASQRSKCRLKRSGPSGKGPGPRISPMLRLHGAVTS